MSRKYWYEIRYSAVHDNFRSQRDSLRPKVGNLRVGIPDLSTVRSDSNLSFPYSNISASFSFSPYFLLLFASYSCIHFVSIFLPSVPCFPSHARNGNSNIISIFWFWLLDPVSKIKFIIPSDKIPFPFFPVSVNSHCSCRDSGLKPRIHL